MKYKIENIRSFKADPADYPYSRTDPELSKHTGDEFEIFIVAENGQWWKAKDFFYCVEVTEFDTIES